MLLVGREPELPYERPPLSKEYMRGEAGRRDAHVHSAEWYEENEVELLTGRNVMGMDTGARTVKLQGGEEVGFGKALIGTGAMVNILRVEGAENEGIHYLRAFGNSDAIRADAEAAEHVVLIGGSYIGTEVAASLTAKGTRCSIVCMEEIPLSRTFGDDAGRWFTEKLEANGVEIHGGQELEAFEGDGRVRAVVTKSGLAIECDAVVVGAGVRPDAMLGAEGRPRGRRRDHLRLDPDDLGRRASSPPATAAATSASSTVATACGSSTGTWPSSRAAMAARGMIGDKRPRTTVVPYFFSDLSDWAGLEYVGGAREWDEVVWRGERADGEFSAWYLDSDRVVAALSVGRSEDLLEARRMLSEGVDVSGLKEKLADPEGDLSEIT